MGATGVVKGVKVAVGAERFMASLGVGAMFSRSDAPVFPPRARRRFNGGF